ncbi:uncharacterized protein LOC135226934 [Macrobrachium nipponense]|uniref:uncharacterized protein LOC135226934 n=1 Tax=Macrobrachium nipponense TaxID=159736 RepID=UPI0030C889E8
MLRSGISVLLLVAVTYAAPRSFPVHQVERQDPYPGGVGFWPSDNEAFRYGEPEEGAEDQYPDVVYDSKPFEGAVDVDFSLNPDNAAVLANGTVTNVIFRDLEHRIAEDVQRMQQDMLLFRRLFGQPPVAPRVPPSLFLPWGIHWTTSDETQDSGPVGFDVNLFGHDDSDDGDHDGDNDDDDDFGIFGGFPILGIDRPLFPGLPELPGVGFINPSDLPGNYSNETSVVHSIDGGQVQVNNTINKESGNDFNAFFHHQVIHFRPDEEEGKVPEEGASTSAPGVPASEAPEVPEVPVTEAPEAPVTEDSNNKDEVTTSVPKVEDKNVPVSAKPPPAIPEVSPEGSSDTRAESFDVAKDNSLTEEEDFEIANNLLALDGSRKAERSLRLFDPLVFPNDSPRENRFPESAHYHAHKDQEGHDAEVITDGSVGKRPADLSKDTRVNYISHSSGGGMAKPDPDAEIFNYGLVMDEERAARRHE